MNHPLNFFLTGNLKTLDKVLAIKSFNTRDMAVAFCKKYYLANLMKVVPSSKESLDQMETWITETWGLARPVFPLDSLHPSQVKKILEVVPIR